MNLSTAIKFTQDGINVDKETLIGAQISIRLNSDGVTQKFYYVLVDIGQEITNNDLLMENIIVSKINKNIPENNIHIDGFSKINFNIGGKLNFDKKYRKSKSFLLNPLLNSLKNIDGKKDFNFIILTNGRISDKNKVIRAVKKGNIKFPENVKIHIFGIGKNPNIKFLKKLSSKIKASFASIENVNDIYPILTKTGIPEINNIKSGRILIIIDNSMKKSKVNIINNFINSLWEKLQNDSYIEIYDINKKNNYFNGVKEESIAPEIDYNGKKGNKLNKMIYKYYREPEVKSVYLILNKKTKNIKKACRVLEKNPIKNNNINSYIIDMGRNKKHLYLLKFTNLLNGFYYNINNIYDILPFINTISSNFNKCLEMEFPENFVLCNINGVYFNLNKNKKIKLKESETVISRDYIVNTLIDVPTGNSNYYDEIMITYSDIPEKISKKIVFSLVRSDFKAFDDVFAQKIGYNDLLSRFSHENGKRILLETEKSVDKYLENEGIILFKNKLENSIKELMTSHNSMLLIIRDIHLHKVIDYISSENDFNKKIIVFNNNENYRTLSFDSYNRNVFAFVLSQNIADSIKISDFRDVNRMANLITSEIVNFMGNVIDNSSNILLIYDFYDIAGKLVESNNGNRLLNLFIDSLIESFEPWKTKLLFLTKHNNIINKYSPKLETVNLSSYYNNDNIDVLNLAKNILDKNNIDYETQLNYLSVKNINLSDREYGNDCYVFNNYGIQRIINKLRINFSIVDGLKEFLVSSLISHDPIIWVQQLLKQLDMIHSITDDTIITNNIKITMDGPVNENEINTLYVDNNFGATMVSKFGIETGDLKTIISSVLKNKVSEINIGQDI